MRNSLNLLYYQIDNNIVVYRPEKQLAIFNYLGIGSGFHKLKDLIQIQRLLSRKVKPVKYALAMLLVY